MYTNGLAVAMAEDLKQAVEALIDEGLPEHYFTKQGGILTENTVVMPQVYETAAAAFVFGGK